MQQQFIYWNKKFTLELAFKHISSELEVQYSKKTLCN